MTRIEQNHPFRVGNAKKHARRKAEKQANQNGTSRKNGSERRRAFYRKTIAAILIFQTVSVYFTPLRSSAALSCSAKAAIVIEAASGTVLYEKNPDLRLPQASTTKIMTALLTLESAKPDETITVSSTAAQTEGSSVGLREGDHLSVRDALYALMLKSGNDAAVALAEHIAGSVESFTEKMNRKAAEIRLSSTSFRNPNGLPDENHFTTARDLANLTAIAMENEEFRKIVATKYTVLVYNRLSLKNSNRLLFECDGVCGVKTGFTKQAGRCLVSAAERNGVRLICVTLNDPDDWRDHAALYDACFSRVRTVEYAAVGGITRKIPVFNGADSASVKNTKPLTTIEIDGKPVETELTLSLPPAVFPPIREFETLGEAVLYSASGRVVSRSPISAVAAVAEKNVEFSATERYRRTLRRLIQFLFSSPFPEH